MKRFATLLLLTVFLLVLAPAPTHAQDVAAAIAWIRANGWWYRGAPGDKAICGQCPPPAARGNN